MYIMEQKPQIEWDQEESDRLVGVALTRLREVKPGSNNARIRQVCGEVESAHRLKKPASLRDALTALHIELDVVRERKEKRNGRRADN